MKSIRVKSYNKLMENIITEADIKLDGNTDDFKGKLKQRIIDALRLAKECKNAAKQARDNGNDEDADWLEKRAEDYETAARNWNQDTIDPDEPETNSNQDDETQQSQTERALDAANAAKRAASSAQDAADEAQKAVEKLAEAGQDTSAAQAAADKAQEKANEAEQAAQEAQEHADNASKAEAANDAEKAEAEANAAEAAQDKAEQAAAEANNAAEAANQKTASERAQDAKDAAEEAAKNAQAKADAAQKKADDLKAEGKDNSDAQTEANKLKDKAEQAKQAAEEAKDHAEKAEEAEKSGDTDTANSEADKAEAAAENAKQSASSSAASSENSSDNSEDSTDSDSNSDSDSDSDSDSNSSSKSKSKSKSSSNSNSNDKSDTSGSDGDSDSDSDDNESQSDDAPIKDPFADEEDIPSMPSMGQQGQEPRDPTIDEIIKRLNKLDGEAKRGAIAGLTDLINNNKNESLTEAFNKGIRDFSDKEWADLNDETVDRIEKIKKIDTIDDIEGKKAKVKRWSDNQVTRQELEDEEAQNAQHDLLQRRAREKELDKYNNLPGIKDFELDFEGCIKDQVEFVLQDFQSYDEINPEYEGEDVIVKADVQKVLPSEDIPSIAVFFDQSSSWSDSDIKKGEQAIATVKQKYVDTGLCKLDLFYFSDIVVTNRNSSALHNGTTAWPDIIRTIASNDPKNVIIMTDGDMNTWNNHGESYTVEGCVWWIWKDGRRAPNLPKQLRGMRHNYECEFY